MCSFYGGIIESILTGCISVWFGSCASSNKRALQDIVNAAGKIVGASLPSLLDIYITCLACKALNIARDAPHPSLSFFHLLLSRRRYHSLWTHTSRLKDSFIHQAVRKLNSLSSLPPLLSAPMKT